MKVSSGVVLVLLGLASTFAESDNTNTISGAEKCSEVKGIDNAVSCVAMSTLRRLEDMSVKENIEIMPGIVLSSDVPKSERESRQQRTMELPKNAEERISKIFDMMFSVMSNLFTGRTLKIKMSENNTNSVMRALEEGRGKMKKLAGPLMMILGAKMVTIIPILLGGLALLSSKALIISKIALILALIGGGSSLFSGGGGGGGGIFNKLGHGNGGGGGWNNIGGGFGGGGYGGGHNYIAYGAPSWGQTWNTQPSQAYPYARSIDDAQDLAYSAQKE